MRSYRRGGSRKSKKSPPFWWPRAAMSCSGGLRSAPLRARDGYPYPAFGQEPKAEAALGWAGPTSCSSLPEGITVVRATSTGRLTVNCEVKRLTLPDGAPAPKKAWTIFGGGGGSRSSAHRCRCEIRGTKAGFADVLLVSQPRTMLGGERHSWP